MVKIEKNSIKAWWALVAICIAIFMALLDVTVVNVALPTIQKSFDVSFTKLQWIVNAYTLMYAVSLLVISKLGDIFGRKRIFILSLTIFTLGSLAGSMASDINLLILYRGIQGIGGSGMMSLSMSLVAQLFDGKQRGIALGIWGSIAGLSTASGPLLGGILIQYFSWRSIFIVNVPIGVIALGMSFAFLPSFDHFVKDKIDYLGILLSTAMMFCLILGLIEKEEHYDYAWTNSTIFSLIGAGALLLAIFIWWEFKAAKPMIDLSMFRSTSFVGACLASFALGSSLYAFYTYLTVLMQNYMGYTALQTGLRQMLISAFSLFLGPIVGGLTNRISSKYLISGALAVAGLGMVAAKLNLGYSSTWEVLILSFVLFGIANATINPSISTTAVSSVEPRHIGMASGVVNVFRQGGTSFGVVILGLSLTGRYRDHISNGLNSLKQLPVAAHQGLQKGLFAAGPFSGNSVLASPKAAAFHQLPIFSQIKTLVNHAYYLGMQNVLTVTATIFIVSAVLCFFLIKNQFKAGQRH